MFNFFLPSKTKKVLAESELILSNLTRNRIYTQDVLNAKDLALLQGLEDRYPALLKAKDIDALEKLNKESMKLGNKLFPPSPWDAWRENVEVFVVAAIMALAIRTFFLQPFKIPTGSMEPTLYGIEPTPTTAMPPSLPFQLFDFLIRGKTYSRVVTKQGGHITDLIPGTMTIWFEYTDVVLEDAQGHKETDRIWIRQQDVEGKLGIYPYGTLDRRNQEHRTDYPPGAALANYVTQTGDQVLVDKVTYNFHDPRRGDVIVFKTAGIPMLDEQRARKREEGSEDFIKRCAGLAGDLIEVTPPKFYIQPPGEPKHLADAAPAYAKEFAQTDSYPGYTLLDYTQGLGLGVTKDTNRPYDAFDKDNTQTYYVPADCYWAMGDNSPDSEDSRYWGGVPRQNMVGRGYFVFWPFTSRWGWIH
jgi:signal peptidase I